MPSQTISKSISSATKDPEVLRTSDWTQIVVKLDSVANGRNELQLGGGQYIVIEPGDEFTAFIEPGTAINIKSTSDTQVSWKFVVTTLSFVNAMLGILCEIRNKR